jgi:adenylate kinase family enzyme
MRIYFTGCHGSGKTTLARYVSEQYNFPIITEVARMILSEKELQIDSLRSNLSIADDYQNEIFYRQIREEKIKIISYLIEVLLIVLAYCAQHTRILDKLMKSNDLEEYVNNLKSKDTLIFFIRPSKITLKEDGVREHINWGRCCKYRWNVKDFVQNL